MKSWMAMDILLRNGANAEDIVITRRKSEAQDLETESIVGMCVTGIHTAVGVRVELWK
jgi:hypothetical protein